MHEALEQARLGAAAGEVPVGAIVVREDAVLARAHNAPIGRTDPTAHAEILVLREAARALGAPRLTGCDLYVTLEPCLMCLGAMVHARVRRLVFGARDPKIGATEHVGALPLGPGGLNHRLEIVGGVLGDESAAQLREFFRERR